MEWIDHHNPDLVVFNDDGSEKERIDMSRYNYAQIDSLLFKKAFLHK